MPYYKLKGIIKDVINENGENYAVINP